MSQQQLRDTIVSWFRKCTHSIKVNHAFYAVTFAPYKFTGIKKSYTTFIKNIKTIVNKLGSDDCPLIKIHQIYAVLEYHEDGFGHYHCIIEVERPMNSIYAKMHKDVTVEKILITKLGKCCNVLLKTRIDEGWVDYMTKDFNKTIQVNYDSLNYYKC